MEQLKQLLEKRLVAGFRGKKITYIRYITMKLQVVVVTRIARRLVMRLLRFSADPYPREDSILRNLPELENNLAHIRYLSYELLLSNIPRQCK